MGAPVSAIRTSLCSCACTKERNTHHCTIQTLHQSKRGPWASLRRVERSPFHTLRTGLGSITSPKLSSELGHRRAAGRFEREAASSAVFSRAAVGTHHRREALARGVSDLLRLVEEHTVPATNTAASSPVSLARGGRAARVTARHRSRRATVPLSPLTTSIWPTGRTGRGVHQGDGTRGGHGQLTTAVARLPV